MEILIVKIGAIGDAVMALGAAQWVKTTYPEARITWLGGEKIVPLLQCTNVIEQIVAVNEKDLFGDSRIGALKALLGVWITLLGKVFDLAVIGHKDWRYRLLVLSSLRRETRMLGRMRDRLIPVPGRYHGDEYLRLVNGEDSGLMPAFSFPNISVPPLSSGLEKILGTKENPWIILAPGGAKNPLSDDPLRRWPVQLYVELTRVLTEKGFTVILTGGESDSWVREWFLNTGATDMIGKTDLKDLMALISLSDLVVAHDSGPLHIATLLGKPLLALFGPTDPQEKLPRQPLSPIRVLWNGAELPCSPCYDGKHYAPCNRNICMEMISVQNVLDAIEQLLD